MKDNTAQYPINKRGQYKYWRKEIVCTVVETCTKTAIKKPSRQINRSIKKTMPLLFRDCLINFMAKSRKSREKFFTDYSDFEIFCKCSANVVK